MLDFYSHADCCFPRSRGYREDGTGNTLRESGYPFRAFPYQERHIQCLWADSRYRPVSLKTSEGESISVEHPGDWNLEPGPDFLNAVLLVGNEKRRMVGDLEIHIHANGWKQHGHAGDQNFANTRFHIVYFQGAEVPGLIQIPLQEILSGNPCFSFDTIDPTAYPYAIPEGNFPLKGIDPDKKTEWLESAGEERLRIKAERLALALQTKEPEQLLWEEVLAALGYKNNKAPFRKLATLLPLTRLLSIADAPDKIYAVLLGLSGLMPVKIHPQWPRETRSFIRGSWDYWWKQPEELKELSLKPAEWTLAGIRPANHPVRRIMAAAQLAQHIPELHKDHQQLAVCTENFWSTHLSWKTACKPTALIGKPRANAIITNILIPFQAAIGTTDLNLGQLPPEPGNSIIRQTAFTLFGPDHSDKVYKSALARQGLLQIFHDYLITHRLNDLHLLSQKM